MAPAASAAVTCSSSMKLVMATISTSGSSPLIRPIAVTPSMVGISRSMSTTSGADVARPPGLAAVAGLADDLDVVQQLEEGGQASSDDRVIVHDQDADRVGHGDGDPSSTGAGRRGESSDATLVRAVWPKASVGREVAGCGERAKRSSRQSKTVIHGCLPLGHDVDDARGSVHDMQPDVELPVRVVIVGDADVDDPRRREQAPHRPDQGMPSGTSGRCGSTSTTSGCVHSQRSMALATSTATPESSIDGSSTSSPASPPRSRRSEPTTRTRTGLSGDGWLPI